MRFPFGTIVIIGATLYASYRGFNDPRFRARYVFTPKRVLRDREYERLITSGFLHLNWMHLLLNMLSFYSIGSLIERVYGLLILLPVYFGSIVGGNLLSLYLHRRDPYYQALGGSGGVSGIIFASIFLFPGSWLSFFFIPMPAWLFAILFILISFYGLRGGMGRTRIGHDAHLGGAIVGLLITTVRYPAIVVNSPFLYALVVGLSVGLLIYVYRYPRGAGPNPFRAAFWREIWNQFRGRQAEDQALSDRQMLNQLLGKIARSGLESLSRREKRQLKAISKRMRDRKGLDD